MAVSVPMFVVLGRLETDLPPFIIEGFIEEAESDLQGILAKTDRTAAPSGIASAGLPVELAPGGSETLTLATSADTHKYIRLEGTVGSLTGTKFFVNVGREAAEAAAVTLSPTTLEGRGAQSFTAELTDDTTLALEGTGLTNSLFFGSLTGLAGVLPVDHEQVILDLVRARVIDEGLDAERIGDYSASFMDYHTVRVKILKRVLFGSSGQSVLA